MSDLRLLAGILVVALVLGAWTWWLHRRLAVAPQAPPWVRRTTLAVVVTGAALYVVSQVAFRLLDPDPWRSVIWVGLTWLALLFYLTLGLLALALGALALRLLGRADARQRLLRVGTPVVAVLALVVTGYGLVEAGRLRVTAYAVSDAALPPGFEGLRIALVTDLHVGPARTAAFTRRVVDLVNAQDPDLVVLGGDLSDGREEYVGAALDPLADLEAPLGVVGVSGNHEFITGDAEAYLARWERLDIRVLRNEHVVLTRDGSSLVVAGVHDEQGEGIFAPDADAALAGVGEGAFTIFVAHEPRQVPRDSGVEVQLSGHTHGGQLWPFHYLVRLQQPTLAGVDRIDDVQVVTSRGVHAPGPPVRILAPPEVTMVTLSARP